MRKIIVFIILLLMISTLLLADQKAITSNGDEVILYNNGTWVYSKKDNKKFIKIKTIKKKFTKSENATFLLKSKINNSAFFINPKKWSVNKMSGDKEYTFELKNKDLYAMVITEEIEVSIEALAIAGYNNAKTVAPDIQVLQKEYRIVNGNKLIYMEMVGTITGIKAIYVGYYFSNSSGSTQFVTYTGASLINKYKPEMIEFLNGLVVQKRLDTKHQ